MIIKENIQAFHDKYRILAKGEGFLYLRPHPKLQEWISNYTITFPTKSMISDNYTVIPHGSATLVISSNAKYLYDNLFGPTTKPCMVGNEANVSDMVLIIEFQPAGLYTFTGIDQCELTDHYIPFREVNFTLSKSILETIERTKNIFELVSCLDNIFLSNINAFSHPQLKYTIQNIIKESGNITVKKLSESIQYSQRHLSRIFEQNVGVSVKTFSRLVRVNNSIRLLQNLDNSISLVSDMLGFYDMSHFVHDFKLVSGVSPHEYRKNMSDFYNEIAKF